ncbi:MAG: Ig-like domain-containing protein, partial [Pirellulaceae bacterium]
YPGLAIKLDNDVDGDFHSAYWGGAEYERLAGLIDIAHEKNHLFIRNPVDAADSRNIRPGTTPAFGRLANIPDADNRRFYPDVGHNTIYLFDPATGEGDIPVHQFNLADPLAGDAVTENAMGYLMRNAQWLVQVVGVDGLRIDAAKHMQGFTLDYLDRAIYRQNPRSLLDGSTKHVFTYSEVYDANPAVLHPHVKKNIDPGDPGRIGGNRDTLDFKLYFSLKENLEYGTQPGWTNWDTNRYAWYQIKDAALDTSPHEGQGDTLHNGNAGVTFVQSHDVHKPFQLDNVAHAYTLMMPGNTVVYFNGKEFGDERDFPKDGRGDALSVAVGSDLTRIVSARNTHGRGDYAERWVDDQGLYAFERVSSSLVLLSNRTDSGFDSRTLEHVGFAPGTYLVELTGNASDAARDPMDDISEVIQVFDDGGVSKVNVRFPRNTNATGDWTGSGYVIYGLPTPQAPDGLELLNVNSVMAGDGSPTNDYENGVQRQSDIHVVTGDALNVRLKTVEVNLLGSLRDEWADGDNALLKLDGGRAINTLNPNSSASGVDFVQPGSVTYGFERFEQKSSPLVGPGGLGDANWEGDGEFLQTIDLTGLEEGTHFLEARAFRHRTDGGPAVFSSFKKVFYVDRLAPESGVDSFLPWDSGVQENRDLVVRSLDKTADNVHVFLNLPAGTSDSEIMTMVNNGQGKAERYDRSLFKYGYFNVPHGNNVATIVSFEATGNSQIQRVPGLFASTIVGAGLGDLNHDGQYTETDAQAFKTVFESNQGQFNPAGDFNADGLTTYSDLVALIGKLRDVSASASAIAAAEQLQDQVFGASDDTYSIDEESILVVDPAGILANDRHPGSDGSLNLETTGEVDTQLGGKATFEATGKLRYVPPTSMQSLGLGDSREDTVQYTVSDGLGSTDIGTVTITVTGVNDAPVLATLPPLTLLEEGSFHGTGTKLGDYVNDIDSDTSKIQYRIANMASIDSNFGVSIGMAINSGQFAARSDDTIHIHPANHFNGQTTVTVEARDIEGDVSQTQTFTITATPVNDAPTLNSLNNLTIDEDASEQTVNLSGISAGGGESQPLRVTTTSSETSLIPHPAVTYTSAEATGTLKFTPVADQSGTATITVTVEDGGLDGDLDTGGDNGTFSHDFVITVNAVNDNPTLNALSDLTIDEDAPQQTVNLTGITAGGGESQPLRVTATSDNTSLIPHPAVTYTSAEATGTLKFTPIWREEGTANITVTVEDGGLDGDLDTANDNATFIDTITIDVVENLVPYRNPRNRFDVNDDGVVTPFDLLLIITFLRENGASEPFGPRPPYLDVTVEDNFIKLLDALAVMTELRRLYVGEGEARLPAAMQPIDFSSLGNVSSTESVQQPLVQDSSQSTDEMLRR